MDSRLPYRSSKREHNPSWLIFRSKDLLAKAKREKDASKLIYCCLELRNCLELAEFQLLLLSLEPWEREEIYPIAKPRHGIDKASRKLKSLNEKYQTFYATLFKVHGLPANAYDFSKSIDLKHRLSDYIHCYTRSEEELRFGSNYMKYSISVIKDALDFLQQTFYNGKGEYVLQNISIASVNAHKQIFQDWKDGKIVDEKELTEVIKNQVRISNVIKRS